MLSVYGWAAEEGFLATFYANNDRLHSDQHDLGWIWISDKHLAEISDKRTNLVLHAIVLKQVAREPCRGNLKTRCVVSGKCYKKFHMSFVNNTTFNTGGYAICKRRGSLNCSNINFGSQPLQGAETLCKIHESFSTSPCYQDHSICTSTWSLTTR